MFKWNRAAAAPAAETSSYARQDVALTALQTLSKSISSVGRDAAAVRGALDDTQRVMAAQGEAMQALGSQLQDIAKAQHDITAATEQSTAAVQRARQALSSVGGEVQGIAQTLAKVSEAAADITKISLQTRLVAFNASVEAKHAGDAGRGFGVVADAIKALAAQVEGSSKAIVSAIATLQQRIDDFGAQLTEPDSKAGRKSEIHAAFQAVQADVERIAESAQSGAAQMVALNGRAQELEREVGEASHGLKVALDGSDRFLKLSEELIEQIAGSGVEVEDGEFIRLAQGAAAEIGRLLESAVSSRAISEADLFDENYRPISGSNPAQHLTQFCPLTDRLLPEVQERVVQGHPKIVFAISADRNGYIATHNKQYCHPQKPGDVVWNTAHSRYRRIFNDRTGLASARNTKPFLLQTYRRDMGGGKFVILKEVAAPITVNGRHWGGFRLAFQF
jgi:methyl-accepting chemotaxis protein